jgi:hypothetical protein
MAQHGVGPVGQNGSDEDTAPFEPSVTDGIHASMQLVEPASRESCLDRSGVETEANQLPEGHHPVLPLGQYGDLSITWM